MHNIYTTIGILFITSAILGFISGYAINNFIKDSDMKKQSYSNIQNITDSIKKVTGEIDSAWNQGDASAFASHWAEDGTVVSPMGIVTEGRAKIEEDMTTQFSGFMKSTTHKLKVNKVYIVNPSVVVADGEAEITVQNNEPWKANFTAILGQDKSGNWLVEHMRSYTFIQQ